MAVPAGRSLRSLPDHDDSPVSGIPDFYQHYEIQRCQKFRPALPWGAFGRGCSQHGTRRADARHMAAERRPTQETEWRGSAMGPEPGTSTEGNPGVVVCPLLDSGGLSYYRDLSVAGLENGLWRELNGWLSLEAGKCCGSWFSTSSCKLSSLAGNGIPLTSNGFLSRLAPVRYKMTPRAGRRRGSRNRLRRFA